MINNVIKNREKRSVEVIVKDMREINVEDEIIREGGDDI